MNHVKKALDDLLVEMESGEVDVVDAVRKLLGESLVPGVLAALYAASVDCRVCKKDFVSSMSSVLRDGQLTWCSVVYPLCADCWADATPASRLAHCRAAWLATGPTPADLVEWLTIEERVLEGRLVGVPTDRGVLAGPLREYRPQR